MMRQVACAIVLLVLGCARAPDPSGANDEEPGWSRLGVYGKLSTYCGAKAIPRNLQTVPEFGCFYLSAGRGATGTLATHRVEVSVNNAGEEVFKVDGALVVETRDTASGTQLPYVGVGGGAGYRFCESYTDRNTGCPASIEIYSRKDSPIHGFTVPSARISPMRFEPRKLGLRRIP